MKDVVRFTPLGDLVTIVMGQAPSSKDCNFDGRGTPFVKAGEFGARRPIIREWTTNPLKHARKTDVLLCVVGATCGKLNLGEDCAIGRSVAAIRPEPTKLDQFYLHYFLMTLVDRLRAGSVGAAQTVISKEMIQSVTFPWREVPEQRRIVAILDEAFEGIAIAKANAEKNLQNARELFDSKLLKLLSDDERIWTRKTLKEVSVEFGRGKSKHRPRNDPKLYGGPYPFIQTGDVRSSDHLITDYTQTYSEAGLAQSMLWPRGTLCITIAANIAETGVLNFDACFPDSVIGVVVDDAQTTSKYLEYMLHTVKADLKAKGKGSAQDNINLGTFENERFPFPDLLTQKRVVGLLDDLSAEVQRLEDVYARKLSALDELKKSLLHQAFTGQL
jgi:type I restriction enzyme S subunit